MTTDNRDQLMRDCRAKIEEITDMRTVPLGGMTEEPFDEERYLLVQIEALHRSYQDDARPYINRLIAIRSLRPAPPFFMAICWCASCDTALNQFATRMSVCPDCGDKRCPKGAHHANQCCAASIAPKDQT